MPSDAGGDGAGGGCERSCLLGWWLEDTGSCSAICTLSPQPAECNATDCRQTSIYHLDDPAYQIYFSAHSEQMRSFTLFTKMDESWALPSACHLTLNASTSPDGSPFTCSATMVDLSTRDWNRMPAELEQALATAASGPFPAHGTY